MEVKFDKRFDTIEESFQIIDRMLVTLVEKTCFINQSRPKLPGGWMINSIAKTNTYNDRKSN